MASKKIYVTHEFQQGAKIRLTNEGSVPAVADGTLVYDGDLRISDSSEYKRVVAGSVDSDGHTVIECEEFN